MNHIRLSLRLVVIVVSIVASTRAHRRVRTDPTEKVDYKDLKNNVNPMVAN